MLVQDGSVPPSVGHCDDQDLHAAIAKLQPPTPLLCLQILEPRLRLDRDQHALKCEDAIPCPKVARDWQRNFRVEWRLGRQERSKPAENSKLPGIDCRSRPGHGASDKLQTDRGAGSTQLVKRHLSQERALDAPELRMGHAHARSGLSLADRLRAPCSPDLACDVDTKAIRDGEGVVEAARAAWHCWIIAAAASPRRIGPPCPTHLGRPCLIDERANGRISSPAGDAPVVVGASAPLAGRADVEIGRRGASARLIGTPQTSVPNQISGGWLAWRSTAAPRPVDGTLGEPSPAGACVGDQLTRGRTVAPA